MFWLVCLYNLPTVVTWLVVMGDVLTITDQFPENIECRSHPAPPSRTHYDITIRAPCPGVTGAQFEVIMRGECVIRWMRPTLSDTRRNYLDIAVILVIREQEAGPGTWHNQIISGPGWSSSLIRHRVATIVAIERVCLRCTVNTWRARWGDWIRRAERIQRTANQIRSARDTRAQTRKPKNNHSLILIILGIEQQQQQNNRSRSGAAVSRQTMRWMGTLHLPSSSQLTTVQKAKINNICLRRFCF